MKKLAVILLGLTLLSGCQSLGGWGSKVGSWFGGGKSSDGNAGTIAEATATSAALDRMNEIAKREAEARKALEAQYEKFKKELQEAYDKRQKIDDENFDKISEVNYGIISATDPVVDLDRRVLIANMKARQNSEMLMPVPPDKKKAIEVEIEADAKREVKEITKKYEALTKQAAEAFRRYAEADELVKKKEAEKAKLKLDQEAALKKIKEDQDKLVEKMKKDADDAVRIAQEKQKEEMVGWIVKSLLGVGIILVVLGAVVLRSPTFIVTGVGVLGLSYVAATIPFWIVAVSMGVICIVLIALDPRKKAVAPTPAPQPTPPATPSV